MALILATRRSSRPKSPACRGRRAGAGAVGWLIGRSVGRSVGRLVGRSVGSGDGDGDGDDVGGGGRTPRSERRHVSRRGVRWGSAGAGSGGGWGQRGAALDYISSAVGRYYSPRSVRLVSAFLLVRPLAVRAPCSSPSSFRVVGARAAEPRGKRPCKEVLHRTRYVHSILRCAIPRGNKATLLRDGTTLLALSLPCSLAPSLPRSLAPSLPRSLAPSLHLSVRARVCMRVCTYGFSVVRTADACAPRA
jgi:hypothetical protein